MRKFNFPIILQSRPIPEMRRMQYKLSRNGIIRMRVVGKGKFYTWNKWGRLQPGKTAEQWVMDKMEDGFEVI